MHFDAAIFDMDGVITDTAQVHAAAWKNTFDTYLQGRGGTTFRPFTQADYLAHVDGRPRYEGVAAFLRSHLIDLPFGEPSDTPETETICGLGNSKDASFNRILRSQGVKVFGSTIALILALQRGGVKVAVATSSKNGTLVLQKAGIAEMFETRVDGVISAALGLMGKPAPDIFVEACERLGACRHRALIVEDAVTGVQAGARGRFGLTLGVARDGNSEVLRQHGADLVVSDLSQISVDEIDHWFETVVRTRPGAPGERHPR